MRNVRLVVCAVAASVADVLQHKAEPRDFVAEDFGDDLAEVAFRGGREIKRLESLVELVVELVVAAGEDVVYPIAVQHPPHYGTYYATDRFRVCNLP